MTSFFKSKAGARDGEYDFFPLPDMNPQFADSVTGGGRPVRHVQRHASGACADAYLLTPEAQAIWVSRGGRAFREHQRHRTIRTTFPSRRRRC